MEHAMGEQKWKLFVWSIRTSSIARVIDPEAESQLDFNLRVNTGGLLTFPKFETTTEIQAELEAALQLLYVVAPNVAASLRGADVDNPWKLDADHPADRLLVGEPLIDTNYMMQVWKAVTHDHRFAGKFGVLVNHHHTNQNPTSSLVANPDTIGLWETSGTVKALFWHQFFDSCFGPVSVSLPSNATVVSVQSYITGGEYLPPFLTVDTFSGRVPLQQLFPHEIYPIIMRTMDDNQLIKTYVKWVGGVYTLTLDERPRLVTIFDWADGSDDLGASISGHWNMALPTKWKRNEFAHFCAAHGARPLLMVFRRV
ncbi:hypothetical protein IWX90DRAFT_515636 [Phyllosticta citrichinensis]|uniref:Uncharacterized protein n=1 Tax=Phyllosticta citrichinensis TaxID=1130410 RepID=A0ABR1XP61_9PEZI